MDLSGNPFASKVVAANADYRPLVIFCLPEIKIIDGENVSASAIRSAKELFRDAAGNLVSERTTHDSADEADDSD